MDDKAIEAVARGICECERYAYEPGDSHYRRIAQAALTAYHAHLKAEGMVIVPVEPTDVMLGAAWEQTGESGAMKSRVFSRMARYYRAMIAASEGE